MKTRFDYNKLTTIVERFLAIILAILIIVGFYIYIQSTSFADSIIVYNRPEDYTKIIKNIQNKDGIAHFPKSIPQNASNTQVWSYIGGINGEVFLLKFDADKNFIQGELKKHQFLNQDTPVGKKQKIYNMYTDNGRITSENYTFYVLDKVGNFSEDKQFFPYFNGIAVDKNLRHILYYHIVPDD